MAENTKSPISSGTHGEHLWLSSTELSLDDLLEACPQMVTNKYVAITSFDSGPLVHSEPETAVGWENRYGVAYSPRITTVDMVPHDIYDEWYVFEERTDIGSLLEGNVLEVGVRKGQVAAFVNYFGFSFTNPRYTDRIELFWNQYELIRPYSFIAEGDLLNIVTSDKKLFSEIMHSLQSITER